MATYQLPREADELTKRIFDDGMRAAAEALASKFGEGKAFDAEDAIRALQLGETKLERKRGPSPKKAEVKKGKKSKVDDEGKPLPKQKKFNGYLVFSAEFRDEAKCDVAAELKEKGELVNKANKKTGVVPPPSKKVEARHITSALGAMWSKLSAEEQQPYNDQAAAAKAEHIKSKDSDEADGEESDDAIALEANLDDDEE